MKVAVCFSRSSADPCGAVAAMAEAMRLYETQEANVLAAAGGALSYVSTSDRFSAVQMIRRSVDGNILLIAGVPLDLHGSLDARLKGAVSQSAERAAEDLKGLDGAFAAIMWDAVHKQLLIVTDPLGLQPLYMAQHDGVLLVASELKAFPASGLLDAEMDVAGWGAFVGFGYPIGDDTQLVGVKRVAGAQQIIYDCVDGKLTNSTYWTWPVTQTDMTLATVDTGRLVEAFRRELAAYAQHARGGTVLLSGGFDSRLTLALLKKEGWSPKAMVLAHQDELWGADGKLAQRVAEEVGTPCQYVKTPRSFYSTSRYLDYLVMNEVTTPSLYLFIAQVQAYLNEDMRVVWDGTPPGYGLVPAFLPSGGFDAFFEDSFSTWGSYVWQTAAGLFGSDRAEMMYEAVCGAAATEREKYPDDESGVTQFEILNRMRNRTISNSLKVYSNIALPCLFGVSRTFWEYAGSIPHSVSRDYRMYHKVFREHLPEVADIPFLSGGGMWCDREQGLRGRLALIRHTAAKSRLAQKARKAYRRWIRGSRRYWAESRYVNLVHARMQWDHPDLDSGKKRIDAPEGRLPFYWQMWRWIMSGELTTWNAESFFDDT